MFSQDATNLLFLLDALLAAFEQKEPLVTLTPTLSPTMGTLDKLCFYSSLLVQESKERRLVKAAEEIRSSSGNLMTEKLHTFFSILFPILSSFHTDENILMHLIENKESFNRFLGPRTIENLLRTFFPSGIEQLRALLSENFARRGFASFFAAQEPLLDALEWEAPCDPLLVN